MAVGIIHETWHLKAACRGPESTLFFPPSFSERREEREAREEKANTLCVECSVSQECLEFALRVKEPHGIWGGLTEMERRRLIFDD
jgi:WhiB family redox-sensing transcriptional regulator